MNIYFKLGCTDFIFGLANGLIMNSKHWGIGYW